MFLTEAVMDDTGAYKIEVSNESGSASGAFKMKVVSKLIISLLCHCKWILGEGV